MKRRSGIQLVERMFLLSLLIILFPSIAATQPQTRDACTGPTNDVTVSILTDPDNEQVNIITVQNHSHSPVVALTIGDGLKPELHTAAFAVPLELVGPEGWKGRHVFKEESVFMHWEWSVEKPENAIAPDEMLSGFKVRLPVFPSNLRGVNYPDGTPIQAVKLGELPFRVQFLNGRCAWGQIQPLIPGSSKR